MTHTPPIDDELAAARAGDRRAFEKLVRPLIPRLQSFAYRMVANADDAAELVQDALFKAHQKLGTFRGEAEFSTWLFSILTRLCLDQLRSRRRWRWDAQHHARVSPDAPHDEVVAELNRPEARFEAREHIAFCFSCVARSLSPEEAAALLLREVFQFTTDEAAHICGVSESVLRHRLSAARQAMKDAYEGLCGLVSKGGVCHQCAGLRNTAPEAQRGEPLPDLSGTSDDSYRRRLPLVRDADLMHGRSAALHRVMFRAVQHLEDPT